MPKELPTLRSLLLLSLLLGISIVSIKIATTTRKKEADIQSYTSYLAPIPTTIPQEILVTIDKREAQLRMSIEAFEKEQDLYTPESPTSSNQTPTPTVTPAPD